MEQRMNYFEVRSERNSAFPFYLYRIECVENTSAIYAHWHEEVEILYVTCNGVITVDGISRSFNEGDIIFINKDQLHHANVLSSGLLSAMVIDYSCLEFRYNDFCQISIIDKLKNKKLFFPSVIEESEDMHEQIKSCLFTIMYQYNSNNPGKELKIKCCLYEILFLLYSSGRFCASSETASSHEPTQLSYVKAAIRYMQDNFHMQLTVDEIARFVSISKYHFIKTFKQIMGITPMVYLRDLRIEKSIDYLKTGQPITQAAYQCGFNNLSYYIRVFRSCYGLSPNEYKKTLR